VVLVVVMIAGYLERLVEERTERAIESLIRCMPTDVLVRLGSREEWKPISEVRRGMQLVVKTGSRIPVDGIVVDGTASINEATLTGESAPKEKGKRTLVFAGTFVESGSIVEAQKIGENTMFGRIEKLWEGAGQRQAKIHVLADKVALILLPVLILLIGGVGLWTRDLRLVIMLLVFGSPLELVLVTPLAILGGTVAAFRNGILVKGGLALERFAHADTMIFDKTGTLTIGEPRVVGIQRLDPAHTAKDIIRMAAIAEKRSGHVLSRAILDRAKVEGIEVPDPDHYVAVSGHGVEVDSGREHHCLGSKHFIEAEHHGNIPVETMLACANEEALHSSFHLACADSLCGRSCVTDEVREGARETIERLRRSGMAHFIVLSGDRPEAARKVAETLGIPKAYGGVLPDQKLKMIEELQKGGRNVAMVGDGINDAPSLKQADVGIAMGAMGMEPAIEATDIALMSNDLSKIVFARELSNKTLRTIQQNIFLGLGFTHGLGMLLALLHLLNPIQAAFFHAVPDLLILFNSARLLKFNAQRKQDSEQLRAGCYSQSAERRFSTPRLSALAGSTPRFEVAILCISEHRLSCYKEFPEGFLTARRAAQGGKATAQGT